EVHHHLARLGMPLRAPFAHGVVVADRADAKPRERQLGGQRRAELPQRGENPPWRDLRRLQVDGGAQHDDVAKREAVFVALAARRRDEPGRDQAGDDAARKAQRLLDAANRVAAGVALARSHFLARVRAGATASSTFAARLTPLRSLPEAVSAGVAAGAAAFAAGAAFFAGAAALPRLARSASTRSITCAPPPASSGGACATICRPAIFSSIAARMRFFSSSSNIVGS